VNAEIETEKLTQQELASFFVLLVTAGNETTRTAIATDFTRSPNTRSKGRLLTDYEGLAKTAPMKSSLGVARYLDAPHAG